MDQCHTSALVAQSLLDEPSMHDFTHSRRVISLRTKQAESKYLDMSGSGLRQDDFRKLLATPRAVAQQTPRVTQTPRPKSGGQKDADGFVVPQPVKHKKKLWKPPQQKKEQEQETGPAYRDRAKERQEGINPDYEETEQMLAVLKASEQTPATEETPASGLTYEQSKYLGGDVKHTHLVKGLDYALLERVKNELQQQEAASQEKKAAQDYIEQLHGGGPAKFNSTFAANIYDLAIKRAKVQLPQRNEMFIPGRLAFAWDLDDVDEDGEVIPTSDIPTTVIRSKADLRDYGRNLAASGSDLVLEKIITIMANVRGVGGGVTTAEKKRVKRKDKERAQAEAEKKRLEEEKKAMYAEQAQDEDDEEDIFADAGRDYTLEVTDRKKKEADSAETDTNSGPGYFQDVGEKEPSEEVPMDVDGNVSNPDGSLSSILKQSAGMLNALQGAGSAEKIVRGLDSAFGPDSGPGPEDASAPATEARLNRKRRRADVAPEPIPEVDSALADLDDLDDSASEGSEADMTQMDLGVRQNKRRQLSRFDFDTEEEWHKYKDDQVHLPKAAFQFGVKASDGRQKQGRKGGDGGKKNYGAKINKEFQQLNKVYRDKYGTDLAKGKNKKQKH